MKLIIVIMKISILISSNLSKMPKCSDCDQQYWDTDEESCPWHIIYCQFCKDEYCTSVQHFPCTSICSECNTSGDKHIEVSCRECGEREYFACPIAGEEPSENLKMEEVICKRCEKDIARKKVHTMRATTIHTCDICGFEYMYNTREGHAIMCKTLQGYIPTKRATN
jgi:hypothetical protein